MCRYVLRPPVARDALELTSDGKVLLRLRRPWTDGTRAIGFEPSELLEKLAAMIPKPRINLLVYHGVFAPNARCRRSAVRAAHDGARQPAVPQTANDEDADTAAPTRDGGRSVSRPQGSPDSRGMGTSPSVPSGGQTSGTGYTRPKYHSWANLLSRTFQIDVLACPGCGGRLRLIATIEHRAVIEKILRYLGLSGVIPEPAPRRHPPWLPGFEAPSEPTAEWPG